MKEKLRAFFSGRNGMDALSTTLSWGGIILMLLSCLIPVDWLRSIVSFLGMFGFLYAYFRVFSRDVYKRQAENQAFLNRKSQCKLRWQQRKTHRFYRCPKCRTVLRVPKGKGRISITCKSCGEKFIRKT